MLTPDETTTGVWRLLSLPAVYETFDALIGTRDVRRRFVQEYIRPVPGAHILDLGCGPGTMLEHLPNIRYTGIDFNESYIVAAQKRYGSRGTFILGNVTEVDWGPDESFDVVVAFGLLHHVSDATAREVIPRVKLALKPEGRFVTLDPCFVKNQNIVARCLHKMDRGNHVRDVEGYLRLVNPAFRGITHKVAHDLHVVPSTTLMMTCLPCDLMTHMRLDAQVRARDRENPVRFPHSHEIPRSLPT